MVAVVMQGVDATCALHITLSSTDKTRPSIDIRTVVLTIRLQNATGGRRVTRPTPHSPTGWGDRMRFAPQ